MNAVTARRNVARQIIRNPVNIVITRSANEVPDGAGGTIRESMALPSQTVRIFMSTMGAQSTAKEGGQIQVHRWGLLAKWDADIQPDDEFTHNERRFRVRSVMPAATDGQIFGHQVDLEEVS